MSDTESTTTSDTTTISTAKISCIVEQLKLDRHRSSTKAQYYSVWKLFNQFFIKLDHKPLSWEDRLTLFVGHLVQTKKKSTTIKSYISAIKAVLFNGNIQLREDRSLLNSLTRACRLKYDKVKTRLPIKKSTLRLILVTLNVLLDRQPYLKDLYKALFVTAYYELFRVSELTSSDHVIRVSDVERGVNKKKLLFILRSSKTHNKGNKPQEIKISATPIDENISHAKSKALLCPFTLIPEYLDVRPRKRSNKEQFFVFQDRSPVKPHHFRSMLKKAIKAAGLNQHNFGSHSFRSGHSHDLLKAGVLVETIQKIGRWLSNAA